MIGLAVPLDGRTALVTGANAGIGRAIALALAANGANLIVHHHGDPEGATGTAASAEKCGRKVQVLAADFTEEGAARALADDAAAAGRVDILVANAAIEVRCPWDEITDTHIDRHVSANFSALVAMCQRLLPPMTAAGWGRVIAIGSIMASRPRAETLVYAALKSAQLTAIQAMAREVAGRGVTMNVISPGAVEIERTAERYADPAFRAAVTAKIPAGRPAGVDDLVGPALFLASDAAGYVTGANIPVDGGWSIGDPPGTLPGPAQ
ncbi:SDR family oxidoreductase [Acuticoccus sp. MNP-M23]|uniref:SDR family NAD(P)-dependent oxidoreductase n=1 Tax=Acuticoccus sp. MNP-M23 TaxID=3072793 RepID=UPI0028166B91|nr:SDR family oxidoreductase [Acuticoccus sp. MNP-M23]WMS42244.1 SDR family oxidoreductase [Acuticoccus sp. MNP-M23]